MPIRKILPTTLLICTFIYLMMCPVVAKITHSHIDQNVIVKADKESSDQQVKKHLGFKLPVSPSGAQTETGFRLRGRQCLTFLAASQPPPILSSLSTIRLIL